MTKQEYQHIRNLAWDLLIDAHITSLPTNVEAIAKVYGCQNIIIDGNSLYNNALSVSNNILTILGYPSSMEHGKCLAVRILSPMIVLKELKVRSATDIVRYTNLPLAEANKRFNRLQELMARDKFETSGLETRVLEQFKPWIATVSSS